MGSKKLDELKLVEKIKRIFPVSHSDILCGVGDDAAVLKFGGKKLLFTTDALLEKIHFDWKWTDPYLLGRKSLSVNLSDIAAMGGIPQFAVLSLAVPQNESFKKIEAFCRGIRSVANQFGVSLVGGDTDRSFNGWKITLALIGEVKKPIYRFGAKVGDQIWVTGNPGFSALGLELLKKGSRGNPNFVRFHLNPIPRLQEGKVLSEKKLANSMIDLSDGLLLDLERLCLASKVGAEINSCSFSTSKSFQQVATKLKKNIGEFILTGGEDYELLFTSSPKNERKLRKVFRKLKTPLTSIGVITSGRRVQVIDHREKVVRLNRKGFVHF